MAPNIPWGVSATFHHFLMPNETGKFFHDLITNKLGKTDETVANGNTTWETVMGISEKQDATYTTVWFTDPAATPPAAPTATGIVSEPTLAPATSKALTPSRNTRATKKAQFDSVLSRLLWASYAQAGAYLPPSQTDLLCHTSMANSAIAAFIRQLSRAMFRWAIGQASRTPAISDGMDSTSVTEIAQSGNSTNGATDESTSREDLLPTVGDATAPSQTALTGSDIGHGSCSADISKSSTDPREYNVGLDVTAINILDEIATAPNAPYTSTADFSDSGSYGSNSSNSTGNSTYLPEEPSYELPLLGGSVASGTMPFFGGPWPYVVSMSMLVALLVYVGCLLFARDFKRATEYGRAVGENVLREVQNEQQADTIKLQGESIVAKDQLLAEQDRTIDDKEEDNQRIYRALVYTQVESDSCQASLAHAHEQILELQGQSKEQDLGARWIAHYLLEHVQRLTDKANWYKSEHSRLEVVLEEACEDSTSKDERIASQVEAINKRDEKIVAKDAKIAKLERSDNAKDAQIARLQTQLEAKTTTLTTCQSNAQATETRLQTQLGDLTTKSEEYKRETDEALDKLRKRADCLDKTLAQKDAELKASEKSALQSRTNAQTQRDTLQKELDGVRSELATAQGAADAQEKRLERMQTTKDACIGSLVKEKTDLETQLRETSEKIDSLKEQHAATQSAAVAAVQQSASETERQLKHSLDILGADNKHLQSTVDHAEALHETQEGQTANCERNAEGLNREINEYAEDVRRITGDKHQLEEDKRHLEEDLDNVQREVKRLNAALAKCTCGAAPPPDKEGGQEPESERDDGPGGHSPGGEDNSDSALHEGSGSSEGSSTSVPASPSEGSANDTDDANSPVGEEEDSTDGGSGDRTAEPAAEDEVTQYERLGSDGSGESNGSGVGAHAILEAKQDSQAVEQESEKIKQDGGEFTLDSGEEKPESDAMKQESEEVKQESGEVKQESGAVEQDSGEVENGSCGADAHQDGDGPCGCANPALEKPGNAQKEGEDTVKASRSPDDTGLHSGIARGPTLWPKRGLDNRKDRESLQEQKRLSDLRRENKLRKLQDAMGPRSSSASPAQHGSAGGRSGPTAASDSASATPEQRKPSPTSAAPTPETEQRSPPSGSTNPPQGPKPADPKSGLNGSGWAPGGVHNPHPASGVSEVPASPSKPKQQPRGPLRRLEISKPSSNVPVELQPARSWPTNLPPGDENYTFGRPLGMPSDSRGHGTPPHLRRSPKPPTWQRFNGPQGAKSGNANCGGARGGGSFPHSSRGSGRSRGGAAFPQRGRGNGNQAYRQY
ncbi:hypothetical protein LTR85_000521 [Meristemomyces frigidus]|nr:hypothetical protein LTR85_000521 [Meristemomyces frigidus]